MNKPLYQDDFGISASPLLPDWVPPAAWHYLCHTELGHSIRTLARGAGVHPSTIQRQVQKYETLRDDPLIDSALQAIGAQYLTPASPAVPGEIRNMNCHNISDISDAKLMQILQRLSEKGAVMALARDMDRAVVVRDGADGKPMQTAVVDRDTAMALAMQNLIMTRDPDLRIVRYQITPLGRSTLRNMGTQVETEAAPTKHRYGATESPLVLLSRRREKDGEAFLPPDLLRAAERLREDYEIAMMETITSHTWDDFITCETLPDLPTDSPLAAAKARVAQALHDLGPGLGDIVLRCCCRFEGLESAEKALQWSARSGKIVLRIALQRLRHHYDAQGKYGPLIG